MHCVLRVDGSRAQNGEIVERTNERRRAIRRRQVRHEIERGRGATTTAKTTNDEAASGNLFENVHARCDVSQCELHVRQMHAIQTRSTARQTMPKISYGSMRILSSIDRAVLLSCETVQRRRVSNTVLFDDKTKAKAAACVE